LEELSLLLPSSFSIPVSVEELAELTPHATNSRYPDDWRSPERGEAEWALTAAERVAEAIHSWLLPRLGE
jgi:HEPN domain-containing protein